MLKPPYNILLPLSLHNYNKEVMLLEKMTEDNIICFIPHEDLMHAIYTIPSIGRQAELKVYLTLL